MIPHPALVAVPARPRRLRAGPLVWLATLAWVVPAVAQAQSVVSASASPSPFPTGSTITITASVQATASPESWCFEWEGCHFWPEPFLQVSGSNGFYDLANGWTAEWGDAGPGQTMLPTTYTVTGGVTWMVCHGFAGCWWYDDPYTESGSAQASVTPMSYPPVPVSVSPNSGAGPAQTFTFVYSSPGGAHDIYGTAQLIHLSSTVNACMTGVLPQSGTIVLYDDAATGYAGVSTVGTPTVLENSQCRVLVGGASTSSSGNTVSVVIPYEFKAGYSGPKNLFTWASSVGGFYSDTVDGGDWIARARIDTVTPAFGPVGQPITISGFGFGTVPAVTINSVAAPVTAASNTSITATIPAGATSGPLVVTTNGQASNSVPITVQGGPYLSSLSPIWGPPVTTTVSLTGLNFGATKGSSTVTINGLELAVCPSCWSDTGITATIPAGATSGPIVVTRYSQPSNGVQFAVGNEEVLYYHSDALGSVRMITDANGQIFPNANSRYDYLPFGGLVPGSSAPDAGRLFTGQERDPETKLDYFGARQYARTTERFTSPDPITITPDRLFRPDRLNRYSYAANNPLRFVDPTGLDYVVIWENGSIEPLPYDWDQFKRWVTADTRQIFGNEHEGAIFSTIVFGDTFAYLGKYSKVEDGAEAPRPSTPSEDGGTSGLMPGRVPKNLFPPISPPNQCGLSAVLTFGNAIGDIAFLSGATAGWRLGVLGVREMRAASSLSAELARLPRSVRRANRVAYNWAQTSARAYWLDGAAQSFMGVTVAFEATGAAFASNFEQAAMANLAGFETSWLDVVPVIATYRSIRSTANACSEQ